ncbi:extracellular solute-binding protein [Bradyrhizobium sp. LHD-71]|uniref:ABC transporter substrate-binding protein n=1 Tax=Bradyrhizobium sp. LHD-71 TaxID=3072141 RepID=UPI00280C5C00|nr:extracellular solute-binding protein [Bradyrhizobium sp. LHD-71]MDQ8729756.1 extracellular solute-binding protein [Bradyrhizobium sp. LHD-71]
MVFDRRAFLRSSLAAGAAASLPGNGFAQGNADYFAALYEQAKREGELTWYIAHWRVEIAERVARRFAEVYPEVKCNVVRATGQVIYQRLSQDLKAKVANCDVFSSTDLGQYVSLKAAKHLMPFAPKNLADCSPLIRNYDPDDAYTITDGNTTVMCYNGDLVAAAEAPGKWLDLIDPKWKGQVAVAHPGFSGAMGGWVLSMNNLYGWEFFEKLKANRPQVGRSLTDPPTTVASGERKIGIGSGASVFGYAARATSLKGVYPEDGAIVSFSPTGIVATTVHPNAAKLFVEFLLSKESAAITASEFTVPVRTDITPAPGIHPLGTLKGITKNPTELNEKLPELIERWRDTFGV